MMTTIVLHALCAAGFVGLALFAWRTASSGANRTLIVASGVTALWAIAAMRPTPGAGVMIIDALDFARGLAWYGFVLHLYRRGIKADGALARTFGTMGLVGLLMAGLLIVLLLSSPDSAAALAWSGVVARLAVAVCGVLLVENLWRNTHTDARWHIKLACIAIGALFGYDIVMGADTVLTHRVSTTLYNGKAFAALLAVPLLGASAARSRFWRLDLHISRTAAFHSATLLVSGLFFVSVAVAGEVFRALGADWGGVAEVGLVFTAILTVGTLITSGAARSRLRAMVVDHFFANRFDYRREWLRCINTLAAPDTYVPLHTRAVRTIADIVDSPAGALWLRDGEATAFHWASSWNVKGPTGPVMPDHPLIAALADDGNPTHGVVCVGDADWSTSLPASLAAAWLAVPLGDARGLIGFVAVQPPRAAFRLDREVYDMLATVGRMVTTFIAEQRMTELLTQTRQLHEYGKRFSFIAHDIKNVSNQLSLMLSNAEIHIANPEFQTDMLGTVRASVNRIGSMLRRLQDPERDATMVVPAERLAVLAAACARGGNARIVIEADTDALDGGVAMSATAFDTVITHLLANAVEASPEGGLVRVRGRREPRRIVIDIIDQGTGMTPEFIRDQLFRPFRTSKSNGTGIGVFQARELLRQAGGDLLAMSEVGVGTTMRLLMPSMVSVEHDVPSRIAS